MSEWRNEVQAAVHSVILNIFAVQAALVLEILFESVVNVVFDRSPAAKAKRKWYNGF